MRRDYLLDLMRAKNTVFTSSEIALIWGTTDAEFIRKKMYRYVQAGKLYSLRKGIYAKDKNYNVFELATKIFTPSYISFETVLGEAGMTFQYYNRIFLATYLTREVTVEGNTFSYRKIKDPILTDKTGIEFKDDYAIALPERAFLDVIYLKKDYHFDNLSGLNWDKIKEILPLYSDKRMDAIVREYRLTVNTKGI
jgi:hypothetical protein